MLHQTVLILSEILAQYYASIQYISCFKEAKIPNTYILSTSPLCQVTGIHKTLWLSVMASVAGLGFQPN